MIAKNYPLIIYRAFRRQIRKYRLPLATSSPSYLLNIVAISNLDLSRVNLPHAFIFFAANPLSFLPLIRAYARIRESSKGDNDDKFSITLKSVGTINVLESCRKLFVLKRQFYHSLLLKEEILKRRARSCANNNVYREVNKNEYEDLSLGLSSAGSETFNQDHHDYVYQQRTSSLLNQYRQVLDTEADLSFRKYVNNKSIAIVGPSLSLGTYGHEIDEHDIVVRLNHTSHLHHDPTKGGRRTNISYFSGIHAHCLAADNDHLHESLEWAVFKSLKDGEKLSTRSQKLRSLTFLYKSEFSEFNLIPLAILDLLRFKPASIKLFGVDLYICKLSPASYMPKSYYLYCPSERRSSPQDRTFSIVNGFLQHDPISQYLFLYRMVRSSLIIGDKIFMDIMMRGIKQYALDLESVYQY